MNFVLKLHLLFYILSQIISLKKYLKLPPAPFIPQKNTSLHENSVRDSPSNFYVSKLHLLFYIFSIISLKEYLNLPPPLSRFMPQKKHLCTKILRVFVLLERKKKNRSYFVISRQFSHGLPPPPTTGCLSTAKIARFVHHFHELSLIFGIFKPVCFWPFPSQRPFSRRQNMGVSFCKHL